MENETPSAKSARCEENCAYPPHDSQSLPIMRGTVQRRLFENGYGVSIVAEADGATYELGVLRHVDGKYARLTYDSGILIDVIRFASAEEIEEIADRVRQLPSVVSR